MDETRLERNEQLIQAADKDILKANRKLELQEELISINAEMIEVINKVGAVETIHGPIVLPAFRLAPEWAELEKRKWAVTYELNGFGLELEKFKIINDRDLLIEKKDELLRGEDNE